MCIANSTWGLFRYCYSLTFGYSEKSKIVIWICLGLSIYSHLDGLILTVESLWPIRSSSSQIAISIEMLIAPIKALIVLDSKVPVKC